jgi:hypothetical protein
MNPFLEQSDTWRDFHNRFITHLGDRLSGLVSDRYLVKVEVRLYLHQLDEPVQLEFPAAVVERHAALEIRDRRDRRVVTVLEVLSPTNKRPGADRDDYLAKRRQVVASQTNLVEIDLLRGGTRPDFPSLPACDYYVLVARYADRPKLGFWPIGLRDPLPTVPVPLADDDPSVDLDLKGVLDQTYDGARFDRYIYNEGPQPPLSTADAAWAREFLPRTG